MQSAFAVLDRPDQIASLSHPVRAKVLASFREPHTAAGVARWLELPRQQVGHHVRALQEQDLLRAVGEKRTGNFIAQILQASAEAYLVSPRALGPAGLEPEAVRDRFSSTYLAAVAGRTVSELGALREQADQQGKPLPTLTVETEIRFRSPAEQAAFAAELQETIFELAGRYHDASAPEGRTFRVTVGAYPRPASTPGNVSHVIAHP